MNNLRELEKLKMELVAYYGWKIADIFKYIDTDYAGNFDFFKFNKI